MKYVKETSLPKYFLTNDDIRTGNCIITMKNISVMIIIVMIDTTALFLKQCLFEDIIKGINVLVNCKKLSVNYFLRIPQHKHKTFLK